MGATLQRDYLGFSPETAEVVGGAGEDEEVIPKKKGLEDICKNFREPAAKPFLRTL